MSHVPTLFSLEEGKGLDQQADLRNYLRQFKTGGPYDVWFSLAKNDQASFNNPCRYLRKDIDIQELSAYALLTEAHDLDQENAEMTTLELSLFNCVAVDVDEYAQTAYLAALSRYAAIRTHFDACTTALEIATIELSDLRNQNHNLQEEKQQLENKPKKIKRETLARIQELEILTKDQTQKLRLCDHDALKSQTKIQELQKINDALAQDLTKAGEAGTNLLTQINQQQTENQELKNKVNELQNKQQNDTNNIRDALTKLHQSHATLQRQHQETLDKNKELQSKNNALQNQVDDLIGFSSYSPPTDAYESIFAKHYPNMDQFDVTTIDAKLDELDAKSNYQPFWDLIAAPPPERVSVPDSKTMATILNTSFTAYLSHLARKIPQPFLPEESTTPAKYISDALSRISKGITQLSNEQKRLSQQTNMDQLLQNLFNLIPQEFRLDAQDLPLDFSNDNLENALQRLIRRATNPIINDCTHPAELYDAINDHYTGNPAWENTLAHVRTHCTNPDTPMTNAPHAEWRPRGQPPAFDGNTAAYKHWKTAADNWVTANLRAPATEAIALLLTGFSGHAASWARQRKPSRFSLSHDIPQNFTQAFAALTREMDKNFIDMGEQKRAATTYHFIKQGTNPMVTHIATFNEVIEEAGFSPNEASTLDRFINSCRPQVRVRLSDWATEQGILLDQGLLEHHYTLQELQVRAQIYDGTAPKEPNAPTVKQPAKSANIPANAADPRTLSSSRDARQLPASCDEHTDRTGCPSSMRGPLGQQDSSGRVAKIALIKEYGRCLICRGIIPPGQEGHVPNPPGSTPSPRATPQLGTPI